MPTLAQSTQKKQAFPEGEVMGDKNELNTLREHIEINSQRFRVNYRDFQADTESGFLLKDPENPLSFLFASLVCSYGVVIPHLYREDGIVTDLQTEQLFQRLDAIDSVLDKALFADAALQLYASRCSMKLNQPLNNEDDLSSQIKDLISEASPWQKVGPQFDVAQKGQALSGAAGVLCVLNHDLSALDRNAGFVGFCDSVFYFGKPPKLPLSPFDSFCVVEFEPELDRTNFNVPYYSHGRALFARIFQSLIGHKAQFGLSITARGLKVFVVDRNPETGEINFFKWPPGDDFFEYRNEDNIPITAKLFMEIARISTKKFQAKSADYENRKSPEDVEMWTWADSSRKDKLFFSSLDMNSRIPDSPTVRKLRNQELCLLDDDL